MKTIQLLFIVLILLPFRLSSQELVVDETFGEKGITAIPGIYQVLLTDFDSEGNILMTAYPEYNNPAMAIVKVDLKGILVEDFGNGGIFSIPLDTVKILDINIDSKDNIVVTGFDRDENLVLIRITKNGILDETFGENGIKTINNIGEMWVQSVIVQSDDRILIGGWYYYDPELRLDGIYFIRLTTEGNRDETFGEKGIVSLKMNQTGYGFLTVLEDYSLVLVTSSDSLIKLKSDGSLDESFKGNGIVNLTYNDLRFIVRGFLFLSDQSFLITGYTPIDGSTNSYCFKMDLQGNIITEFGEEGFLAHSLIDNYGIIEQPDGKILLLGYYDLLRITPRGEMDTGFANKGVFSHKKNDFMYVPFGFTLMDDGKIMLSKDGYFQENYYVICLDKNGEVLLEDVFYKFPADYSCKIMVYNDCRWLLVSRKWGSPLLLTRIKLKMKDDTSIPRIKSGVSVYPSGTSGSLKIESEADPVRSVIITGIDGRMLFSKNYGSQHSVQVDNLPVNTVVILRITLESGEVISCKSVVK
ncbi:MAG: hypothetical protein LIO93_07000 [Bacteroidales bacterium]|nr:hypothetical protein [Bacteroidales bacterium]